MSSVEIVDGEVVEVIDAEVIDGEVVDGEVIDAEVIDGEVVDGEVIDDYFDEDIIVSGNFSQNFKDRKINTKLEGLNFEELIENLIL